MRKDPGGRQESDCTSCPPGYYCISTTPEPIICPVGHYCPQQTEIPIPCPKRQYNPSEGGSDNDNCLICPGGYLCNETGISDLLLHPCRVGYYCVEGATSYIPCPPGTYQPTIYANSVEACRPCEPGYYCPGYSELYIPCPAGTYCPGGQPFPLLCIVGHLCTLLTVDPPPCPANYYCPKYDWETIKSEVEEALEEIYEFLDDRLGGDTDGDADSDPDSDNDTDVEPPPLTTDPDCPTPPCICPENAFCPTGSFAPGQCIDGYQEVDNVCEPCPAGTYSNFFSNSQCLPCDAGYLCIFRATRPDP